MGWVRCARYGVPSPLQLPDDNLHAPNEKISLPCLFGGSEMVARYVSALADSSA
ncbi:MAG: hypothetical protein N2385_02840 [Chloroflexus sp.]|nr:hypothetical protein [Chloroflexus sp.]